MLSSLCVPPEPLSWHPKTGVFVATSLCTFCTWEGDKIVRVGGVGAGLGGEPGFELQWTSRAGPGHCIFSLGDVTPSFYDGPDCAFSHTAISYSVLDIIGPQAPFSQNIAAPGFLEGLLGRTCRERHGEAVVWRGGVANLYDALGRKSLWRRLYVPGGGYLLLLVPIRREAPAHCPACVPLHSSLEFNDVGVFVIQLSGGRALAADLFGPFVPQSGIDLSGAPLQSMGRSRDGMHSIHVVPAPAYRGAPFCTACAPP